MASAKSKSAKKAAKVASRSVEQEVVIRDDGHKYQVFVVGANHPAYAGAGVSKAEATRLGTGLVAECYIKRVDID
jgi:hypothetical protein